MAYVHQLPQEDQNSLKIKFIEFLAKNYDLTPTELEKHLDDMENSKITDLNF